MKIRFNRPIAALTALGTLFALAAPSAALAKDADTQTPTDVGTTYYVDSKNGDDAANGTSEATAWKTLNKVNAIATDLEPGDKVLLKRGSTFNNQWLHIKDTSGTADAPITIADYGDADAAKPIIAANGVAGSQWYQDYKAKVGNHKNKGTVSSTILLKDVSYITVKNLEITNDDPDVYDPIDSWKWTDTADSDNTKLDRSADRMDRTGVAGIAENGTTMSHVTLDGLNIHDVDGNIYNKHLANGGIYFMAHLPKARTSAEDDAYLKSHVSRFDHVTIKNSIVKDVDRWGIAVGYTAYLNYIDNSNWNNGFKYGERGEIADDVIAKYGATNVVIENNYIKGAGGDAITVMYCDRPLIQYNVGDSVSKHMNTADYTQPGSYGGRVAAGIWPWRSKDPVFQYNEMYNNLNATHGNGDGQAWDADYGDGTLYQYNYSYGNTFAALMICNWYAINTTFRYNISQNDRQGVFDLPTNGTGNHIYNNTVYIGEDSQVLTGRSNSQAKFENNIFINATSTKKTETWNRGNTAGGQTYNNNLYVNYANTPASDKNAKTADDVAKVLVHAGKAPTAAKSDGTVHGNAKGSFDGYKPAADSPAINAGVVIADLNDYPVTNDFMGNSIKGLPDIGAVESDVASVSGVVNAYETATKDGKKIVYVPFTAKNPTTVAELRKGVTPGEGAVTNVYRASDTARAGETKLADTDAIKAGDVLRFEVEGSNAAPIDYTIEQKNDWNWVKDYTHGTQGFSWKAQQKAANGDWTDITTFDTQWSNWKINNADYPVGIENPTQGQTNPTDRDNIHGLLAPGPNGYAGAIAWKAPKTGTITLSFKNDEPVRRAVAGGSDGTVVLAVTNGTKTVQSVDLSTTAKPTEGWTTTQDLEVKAGEWIRVSAVSKDGSNLKNGSLRISPTITYKDVAPTVSQADQYAAAYKAVDATVGTKASATIAFTDAAGKDATPTGVKPYAFKGEAAGLTIDQATGTVEYTPANVAYGTVKTATVTVTYSDDTTDEATVTFNVAQSDAQRLNVFYPAVTGNAGTDLKRTPKVTLKADSAAATLPTGTKFALGAGAPTGAKIDATTGEVTLNTTTGGTVSVPVTVTFPDTNEAISVSAVFTVTAPASLGASKLETGTTADGKVIYVPFTEKNPTTVAQLLDLVTAEPTTAAKAVYRGDTKLENTAAIQAGDVLRFSAEGSTVHDDYKVVQKNEWNWVDEFTVSEGVIMNSQKRDGENGAWSNITTFSSQYPMSMYNSYYGAGLTGNLGDLPAVGQDRGSRQGLLIDDPGSAGGTAIAWVAPKAGNVKVSLDRENEPQRRNANAAGNVTLSLTKNGTAICTTTISKAQTKDQAFADCVASKGTISVAVGDVIRFEAVAASGVTASDLYVSPVFAYTDEQTPTPVEKLADQYEPSYQAVDATVGTAASAKVAFAKAGAAAAAPEGTTYVVAGDGFTVAADGTVSYTPTEADYGKAVKATVTVTYSDKSTDTAEVTFNVAAKPAPVEKLADQYAPAYPQNVEVKADESGTAAVTFTKADTEAAAPADTTFALADGADAALSIDKASGKVTFDATGRTAGTKVSAKVTVTYSDKSTDETTVTFTVTKKDEPTPVEKLADQYVPAYEETAAKVGTAASAKVAFAKAGAAAAAPEGTTYAVAGDGFTV
ncbi:Rib/alpha-like domain-containing protein, partial [Bifidobacterium jacchi]|uniref:Rib/alpha-like domain-containing protein n=1 Tax=Bifidobacterium jacchi TaxID=2490545 RepID=UPI001883684B